MMPRCHIAVFVRRAGATSRCSCAPPCRIIAVFVRRASPRTPRDGRFRASGFLCRVSLRRDSTGRNGGRPRGASTRSLTEDPLHSPPRRVAGSRRALRAREGVAVTGRTPTPGTRPRPSDDVPLDRNVERPQLVPWAATTPSGAPCDGCAARSTLMQGGARRCQWNALRAVNLAVVGSWPRLGGRRPRDGQ